MPELNSSLFESVSPVMWVLIALGLATSIFFIERILYFHRIQIKRKAFIDGIKNLLDKQHVIEALTVCEETPGPTASIVKSILLHTKEDAADMQQAAQKATLQILPELQCRLVVFPAIVRIAPLLGLLGTILGLIQAFGSLEAGGVYAHLGYLSGGVYQSLLSTALGLVIAIVAAGAHYFFNARLQSIVHDMNWSAHQIIQYIVHELALAKGD